MQECIDVLNSDLAYVVNETDIKLDTKVSWSDENCNKIELPNHGQIYSVPNYDEVDGKYPELGNGTLFMLSKYNHVEVGTTKYPLNLNGARVRPTYNDDEEIALYKDVKDLEEKHTNELNQHKSESDERFDKDEALIKDLDLREKNNVDNLNDKIDALEVKHDEEKKELQDNIDIADERAKTEENTIKESLKSLVNDVKYNKETCTIDFLHDSNILCFIDAKEFIKDGMVSKVHIDERNLCIEFNVDAGLENMLIPLDDIFNPDNYYTKNEINDKVVNINTAMFQLKSDLEKADADIKSKVDNAVDDITDNISDLEKNLDDLYTKEDNDVTVLQNQIDSLVKKDEKHDKNIEDIYKSIDDINETVDNLDNKVDNINNTLSEAINDLDNDLNDKITDLDEELSTNINALETKHDKEKNEIDTKLDNKVDWVNDKTCIAIPNDGMLLATVTSGKRYNLVKMSNDMVELGNEVFPVNLNGSKVRPTYNTKDIALFEDIPDVANFFDAVRFDKLSKRINFYQGDKVLAFIDASDFIKDGMVRRVKIEDGYLQIQFNSDAELDLIQIPLTDIFNPDNYYTIHEVDKEVTGIKTRLSFLEQEDVYITGQINNISEKIEGLRDDMGHAQSDITLIKSDILALHDIDEAHNDEIKHLKEYTPLIDDLVVMVDGYENDMYELQNEQAKLERDNDNLNAEIVSVKLDINNINSNISHINDDIDDINIRLRKAVDNETYQQDLALVETKLHAEQTYSTKVEVADLIQDLQNQITELKEIIKWYEYNS